MNGDEKTSLACRGGFAGRGGRRAVVRALERGMGQKRGWIDGEVVHDDVGGGWVLVVSGRCDGKRREGGNRDDLIRARWRRKGKRLCTSQSIRVTPGTLRVNVSSSQTRSPPQLSSSQRSKSSVEAVGGVKGMEGVAGEAGEIGRRIIGFITATSEPEW